MVKRKIGSGLFYFSLCSFLSLAACSFDGPHKPVPAQDALGGGQRAGGTDQKAAPSYADVQPTFQSRCTPCHVWSSNQDAAVAAAKSTKMARYVETKYMPLQGSAQAAAITDDERALIVAWARSQEEGAVKSVSRAPTPGDASSVATVTDRNLSFAFQCQQCHGPQGTSTSPDIPNLAGHSQDYILTRLQYFMSPDAKGTLMPAKMKQLMQDYQLKDFSDPATKDLLQSVAAFYGTYNVAATSETMEAARAKLSAEDKALYEAGKKLVADNACVSCHLPADLKPMPGAPMIFGQKSNYVVSRLKEFKSGSGGETMPSVIAPIDEKDFQAIALYLNLTAPAEAVAK